MDQSYSRSGLIRQDEDLESNSSDEDSSNGDYDGPDVHMIHPSELELEDELCYEFPRDDLAYVIDGINKSPWVVYPHHLSNCIGAAAKIAHVGREDIGGELRRLQTLYREGVPSAMEKCLDDKVIWKWENEIHVNIFDTVCRLMDLVVVKLPQLLSEDLSAQDDMLPLLRITAIAFDKQSQYHLKHKQQALPSSTPLPLSQTHKFARPVPGTPPRQRNGDWYCSSRKGAVHDAEGCECTRCSPPDMYCWLSYLLNYFGQTPYGNGFHQLLLVLGYPERLPPAIMEALLLPIAKATDFLTDEVVTAFAESCSNLLKYVSDLLEKDVDALSDKTRDGSFGALSMILKHLQSIISRSSSVEKAESTISIVQRRMVERMLGFNSFNKQLSAVREINKLLENARAISSRDKSRSMNTTIQWLETNDIVRRVLRSHLHHKQYVDQVVKIMRFLLVEHRLSEEHLDAIWGATEKPDQFETVKANIFDLLADLAWSFSPEQLDGLFGRFERSLGRSASDIVLILSLVKKLARSDTKGVLASRLLELLWSMMHSGEAPAEVLESGALTEILGHYDSVNCASKDVYILRCLENLRNDQSVIPSLRLLREIILLDNEKPFYQGEVSRQLRLQSLIQEHVLLHMVVSSLEKYLMHIRAAPIGLGDRKDCSVDGRYSHEEHVKERLSFLLFALQSGEVTLPWDAAERLWNCMIEPPACLPDRERGLQWFCNALEKLPTLSCDAQLSILTKKITTIEPSQLSLTAWRCFMKLFLWVNLNEGKLKKSRFGDSVITHDLDLVGLPYMWQVALYSTIPSITEQSMNMLRDTYTCLSDSLQEKLVPIRQSFVDECMRHLSGSLENDESCGTKTGADSVFNGGHMKGSNLSDNEGNQQCSFPYTTQAGKNQQVERCLCLLKVFIIKCEGKCTRKVPAHGASFKGRPINLLVCTANKHSTRFDLRVHSNEYLGSLRAKVAKKLDCPIHRVRLMHHNHELTQDSQVLRQCGLSDHQPIVASVSIVDPEIEQVEEDQLPGILMSRRPEVYDILFDLTNAKGRKIREGANCLLSLLPTHPIILKEFQNLHTKTVEEGTQLLARRFATESHLIYILQVIDGLLMPVNQAAESPAHHFHEEFLKFGGFQHLMNVFEPKILVGVDDQIKHGCYMSALRIMKFLLERPHESEHHTLGREDASNESFQKNPIISAENGLEWCQPSRQKNGNNVEEVVMREVVAALKRLTWACALKQITSFGSAHLAENQAGVSPRSTVNSFYQESQDILLGDDHYLCLESLELLVNNLLLHPSLIIPFLSSPDTSRFIVDMVLHASDEVVRSQAALSFLRLSKASNGSSKRSIAHRHILSALLEAKSEANQRPEHCLNFMELVGQLLYSIEGPEEYAMAEQQLSDEITWLNSAPIAINGDDRLLEGHLLLIRVLVEKLDFRIIGFGKPCHGAGLVEQLIKKFLFPESALLCCLDQAMDNGNGCASDFKELVSFIECDKPRCGTAGSREKAFQLLTCLATHCIENLRGVVDLLLRLHFSTDASDWEHLPSYGRKAFGGYVGLKNAGATCYMNAVFQQLYMQPEVRHSVLACMESPEFENQDSVFFQVQSMFGALLESSLDHYTPQGFWCAYRDYDGLPINLREHQDAFEFFNRLYDAVDETLKATNQDTTLTKIFGGIFVQQVISRGCSHRSEMEEPFAAISVDVKNKKDLLESLESFVRGDLLEADNAYFCEECGVKVDALKRVCVRQLPQTLVIHLKRFDFDYETMQRLKLKDRFEFPMHLDMKPFTVEGLALRDGQQQGSCSPKANEKIDDIQPKSALEGCNENLKIAGIMKPDSYYKYELVGVVVHSGTAFAGHYYSYIRERPRDCSLSCNSGHTNGWLSFDDKRVEPYDINDLEKDCFGGKYTIDVYDNFLKTSSPQEFDRPNSAYMLLYERCQDRHSLGEVQMLQESVLPHVLPHVPSTSQGQLKGEDDHMEESLEGHVSRHTRPTDQPTQMPSSIRQSVWKENLRFVHENHLLDKNYFKFLYTVVDANRGVIEKSEKSMGPDSGDVSRDLTKERNRRRAEAIPDSLVDEFAKLSLQLATEFMFKIYLRTHCSLREDLHLWKAVIGRLLETNMAACHFYIKTMAERPHWILEYLLKCPVDDVRQSFASLLIKALRCACYFYSEKQGTEVAPYLYRLIEIIICSIRDVSPAKAYLQQYLQVIFEYTKIGPEQQLHLLQLSLIGYLVGFATKVQVPKLELSYLNQIVSLLVRSCDISKYYNSEQPCDHKNSSSGSSSNPLQLNSMPLTLPKDAEESVLKHPAYVSLLIKRCCDQEEVIKLLEFCCWRNTEFTFAVLQETLEALHLSINSEAKSLLLLAFRLLKIEDQLQLTRQELLLLGCRNFPPGVMDLVVVKAVSIPKRYFLIKFIVGLVESCPATRRHVLSRRSDWKRAIDWLHQELNPNGSPKSVNVQAVSNEDLSTGYLLRTSSSEWTLSSARSLLS